MKNLNKILKFIVFINCTSLFLCFIACSDNGLEGGDNNKIIIQGVPGEPFTSNDPFFGPGDHGDGQWYLDNSLGYAHINVTGAWEQGYTGDSILIGLVDQGISINHEDLVDNYRTDVDWDFLENDDDPSTTGAFEYNGTACAGLVAARGGNGKGVTGVAPHAHVAALRMAADDKNWSFDTWKTSAIGAALHRNDVFKIKCYNFDRRWNHNATLGEQFDDDSELVTAIKTADEAGVINIVTVGLGSKEDANTRMVMASRHVLAVGAVGHDGLRGDRYALIASFYGALTSSMFVCAPATFETTGNHQHNSGLTALDQKGNKGGNNINGNQNYNDKFRAPSAASSIVSGVVALILQANPNLDTRGVKHVLANTSVKTESEYDDNKGDPLWVKNAAGLDYSTEYGFGIVDATAAVNFAKTYSGPGTEVSFGSGTKAVGAHEFGQGARIKRNFTIAESYPLETIELRIDMSPVKDAKYGNGNVHWSSHAIYLTSPSGTRIKIMTTGNGLKFGVVDGMELPLGIEANSWLFSSPAFWGENPAGEWEVEIYQQPALVVNSWDSFEFTGYGSN